MVPPWLDEERQAALLRTFELALVPGLLQTPEYAAVLLDGDDLIKKVIEEKWT
jgi:hypothetical protein